MGSEMCIRDSCRRSPAPSAAGRGTRGPASGPRSARRARCGGCARSAGTARTCASAARAPARTPTGEESVAPRAVEQTHGEPFSVPSTPSSRPCLLYTSDAADDMQCVDLGGRRIIKKKKTQKNRGRGRARRRCCCFFFFKQKTAYEIGVRLVGSEMCIRDRSRSSAVDTAYPPTRTPSRAVAHVAALSLITHLTLPTICSV